MISLVSSNKRIFLCLIAVMSLFLLYGAFVYGDKSVDYEIDDVQIEALFELEQEVLENYEIASVIGTEGLEKTSISEVEAVANKLDETTNKISSMKIEEFEEEYVARNNMSGTRQIDSVESSTTHIWPVEGYTKLSSPYGWRNCPYHGREYHSGIDIPAPSGTPIKATKNGIVISSGWNGGYGNCVVLQHSDGGKTLYAHMKNIYVSVNQEVSQGDVIGGVGTTGNSTGNHLHFEIWTGASENTRVNPMNYY